MECHTRDNTFMRRKINKHMYLKYINGVHFNFFRSTTSYIKYIFLYLLIHC